VVGFREKGSIWEVEAKGVDPTKGGRADFPITFPIVTNLVLAVSACQPLVASCLYMHTACSRSVSEASFHPGSADVTYFVVMASGDIPQFGR
jgi:hypothetical protein